MKIINYSEARANLRAEIDSVVENSEPTCIVSRKNQVVVMSKEDYDILNKVFHSNMEKR